MRNETKKSRVLWFMTRTDMVRWTLLAVSLLTFAVVLTPNLIVRDPEYAIGDVVGRNIKAPRDFFVQDEEATQRMQRQAEREVLTVYDHDIQIVEQVADHVRNAFGMMRDLYKPKEKSPTAKSPTADGAAPTAEAPPPASAAAAMNDKAYAEMVHDRVWAKKEEFERELGVAVSEAAFRILEKEMFSEEISELIVRIVREIMATGIVANREVLLRDHGRGIVLRAVGSEGESVIHNLRAFRDLDQAKNLVRIVGQPELNRMNYALSSLIVDLCQRLIQPNITQNRSETQARQQAAVVAVKPVLYQIKAGEIILREGERVTEKQLLKLKALRSRHREEQRYIRSVGALLLMLNMVMIIWFLHSHHHARPRLRSNKELFFITTVLLFFFFVPGIFSNLFESAFQGDGLGNGDHGTYVFGVPMAAGAMIICLFLGFETAVCFSLVLSSCSAIALQGRLEIFIFFFLSSLMGAYWMKNCRERRVFVHSGVKLGALNALLAVAVSAYVGEIWHIGLLQSIFFAFMGGLIAGLLAAAIVPLLEMGFNYTTDITLLELANLERPILRQLMMVAPGTYHHSIVVGSMVEAAAAEIGANPLLAKVCGYYHDIGKMKKPIYFIENQNNGKNRHDQLAPSMSGLILISHVKDGVEIARKHRLGPDIKDAIRQHHGTSVITYFYEKAKRLKGEHAVKIDDYRYPGPKPETKEIALVMLADVVEAASRSLENPTPSRIQNLVRRLIHKIFNDGQLDNCELTLRDLHKISKSFNKILNGIHHHRVEYPDSTPSGKGRGGDGYFNIEPTGTDPHRYGASRKQRAAAADRIGVS